MRVFGHSTFKCAMGRLATLLLAASATVVVTTTPTLGASSLGSGVVRLTSISLHAVGPTVPVNTAFALPIEFRTGDGTAVSDLSVLANDPNPLAGLRVRAALEGPGLAAPLVLEAIPLGGAFAVPALTRAGSYTVEDLRVEDAAGTVILRGEPAVITVSYRVLVTTVWARPLSLEEILDRGIVMDDSNFTAYARTSGLATESPEVRIAFDVTIRSGPVAEDGPAPGLPPIVPGLDAEVGA